MAELGFPIDFDRPLTRRAMLLGTLVGPVLVAACDATSSPGSSLAAGPTTTPIAPIAAREALADHLLRRATFGITPEARAAVSALGPTAWIDQQLAPESIDDSATDDRVAELASLRMDPAETKGAYGNDPGMVIGQLAGARLFRAIHSERQLYEVMVGFWSDHFNIDMTVGPIPFLKGTDEREVIRPHALGRFADLLAASAGSPAMLYYLDNAASRADGDSIPNENYARELLELHTVGVDGAYDEDDVVEVARVFSGWTIDPDDGRMRFRAAWHSMDDVSDVLGWRPNGLTGRAAGESLIDHLAHLPQTAHHLATKLCRRFVADDPSPALVRRVAAVYLDEDTAIAPVVHAILTSKEFAKNVSTKTRRPFEFLAGQARALGLDIADLEDGDVLERIFQALQLLGEPVYTWPSPDGPPDVGPPWLNAESMLQRWNIVLTLTGGNLVGMGIDLERHRPEGARDAEEFIASLAYGLGVELDAPTTDACLGLLALESDSPPPDPQPDVLRELAALVLVSPAAHRR